MFSKKWNILVISLIIMIITSVLAMLIVRYVISLLDYSTIYHDYHKSYYLANAWIEYQLTELQNYDFGYESTINTWENLVTDNFDCPDYDCVFNSELVARTNIVSDASRISQVNPNDRFEVQAGEWVIVPLFYDQWGFLERINSMNFNNIEINKTSNPDDLIVAIVDQQWNTASYRTNDDQFFLSDAGFNYWSFETRIFLVVANPVWGSTQRFYIDSPSRISHSYLNINSVGNYKWRTVTIQGIKDVSLPDYLIYSIIED